MQESESREHMRRLYIAAKESCEWLLERGQHGNGELLSSAERDDIAKEIRVYEEALRRL